MNYPIPISITKFLKDSDEDKQQISTTAKTW